MADFSLDMMARQMRYEQKSDAELQITMLEIAKKMNSFPSSAATPALNAQLTELSAEYAACKNLLEARKESRERLTQAHQKWEESLSARRYAAVLNLKNAVTPSGQLIAAIIEDEGSLSEHEIATWCEELEALDENELHLLLAALIDEGVISFENGRYTLKQICTENLFPDNPVDWMEQHYGEYYGEDEKLLLRLVAAKGSAICVEDFPEIVSDSDFVTAVRQMGYPRSERSKKLTEMRDRFKEPYMGETILTGLNLKPTTIDGFTMYYFPMLGETEAR